MDPKKYENTKSSFYKSSVKTVEGYVHYVSDVKFPPSGNRYFDFKVQESNDERRVVCFDTDQREDLVEKERNKEPVKLVNVSPQKRKYQPDFTEYKMNSYSKVAAIKNLSFPWKDLAVEDMSIKDILDRRASGDVVSLKGKIVWKSEDHTVFSSRSNQDLKKCDIVVEDSTGATTITLWKMSGEQLEVNRAYAFHEFKVGFFKKKCLNSTSTSEIKKLNEDIEISAESHEAANELIPKGKVTEVVHGSVLGVEIKKMIICINCNNKLTGVSEEASIAKCLSCNLSMRKEKLKETVFANLVVGGEDNETIGRFHASESVLNAMFNSIASTKDYNISVEDVSELSEDMMVETLLLVKKVMFELVMEEKVIEKMQVSNQ